MASCSIIPSYSPFPSGASNDTYESVRAARFISVMARTVDGRWTSRLRRPGAIRFAHGARKRSPPPVTPPLAVHARPDRPARHAGEGDPHAPAGWPPKTYLQTSPEPRVRAAPSFATLRPCGCARLGGWRRASSTPPSLGGAASRLSPHPPTPSCLLRSRPFGPIDGRCRDFANAAGQFARRQHACAADAFAPALAARSRLDGRCSFAASRCAPGCSPRRYLGVRFGFIGKDAPAARRESASFGRPPLTVRRWRAVRFIDDGKRPARLSL